MYKSPVLTNDSSLLETYGDTRHIAGLFFWFTTSILVALVLGIFIVLSNNDILIAFILAFSILPVLAVFIFIRQYKFEWAAIFLATVLFTMATLVATLGLGIHHISNLGFPAILIVASLVTRKQTMIFLTVFAIACVAWLVFGELSGVYTPAPLYHSVPGDFFSASITIVLTAFMVRLLSESLFHTNRQLQKELTERGLAEAQLEQDVALRLQVEDQIRYLNADLEKRVQERTAQLETANRELESFSYSISHDLRAPLRAISSYSAILNNEFGKQLDEEGRDFLEKIIKSSVEMNTKIDGLLTFARLARGELKAGRLSLSEIAEEVMSMLRAAEPERRVDYRITPDLTAYGDSTLLRVVLENLLGNAWKYSSKTELAHIEFGMQEYGDGPAFFVRDNGIGFNMKYADKLFGTFQRLHSIDEFEGHGIGLALVKKIIERHNGRIWAEGELGQGATFYFTIPFGRDQG